MNVYRLKITDFRPQQDWLYRILFAPNSAMTVVGSENTLHQAFKVIQEVVLLGANPNDLLVTWDHVNLRWTMQRAPRAPFDWPDTLIQIDVEVVSP